MNGPKYNTHCLLQKLILYMSASVNMCVIYNVLTYKLIANSKPHRLENKTTDRY